MVAHGWKNLLVSVWAPPKLLSADTTRLHCLGAHNPLSVEPQKPAPVDTPVLLVAYWEA